MLPFAVVTRPRRLLFLSLSSQRIQISNSQAGPSLHPTPPLKLTSQDLCETCSEVPAKLSLATIASSKVELSPRHGGSRWQCAVPAMPCTCMIPDNSNPTRASFSKGQGERGEIGTLRRHYSKLMLLKAGERQEKDRRKTRERVSKLDRRREIKKETRADFYQLWVSRLDNTCNCRVLCTARGSAQHNTPPLPPSLSILLVIFLQTTNTIRLQQGYTPQAIIIEQSDL